MMRNLRNLVSACNFYVDDSSTPSAHLLENVALYMTKMLRMFGALPSDETFGFPVATEGVDAEATVIPFASLVADFREEVRQLSLQEKCKPSFLVASDVYIRS